MREVRIENLSEEELRQKRSNLVDAYLSAYQDLPEYAYDTRKEVKSYLNWLYRGDPSGFFVAKIGDEIVGFLSCHSNWMDYREGKVCELHEFVVRKEFQGKGIGKALLEKVIEYARSKGRQKITLWVGEGNAPAIAFYKKRGFVYLYKSGIWVRMSLEI